MYLIQGRDGLCLAVLEVGDPQVVHGRLHASGRDQVGHEVQHRQVDHRLHLSGKRYNPQDTSRRVLSLLPVASNRRPSRPCRGHQEGAHRVDLEGLRRVL